MESDFYSKYVGQVFERLTIKCVVRVPKPKFVCECICGGSITTDVHSVLDSKTLSCGCIRKDRAKESGKKRIKSEGKAGQVFKNKANLEFEIVQYVSSSKVLVRFLESGFEKWSAMKEINKGSIRDWISTPLKVKDDTPKIRRKRKTAVSVGDVYTNFYGCSYKITELLDNKLCKIKFTDEFGFEKVVARDNARLGIRNPFRRLVANIGYVGDGEYSSKSHRQLFTLWHNMITRCYDEDSLKKNVTYQGCSVVEDWHCFQNFAKWCETQNEYILNSDWCLDKDIIEKGNKVYSPDKCSFVPVCINNLFTLRVNKRGDYPLGVHRERRSGRFVAQVNIESKRVCLGRFDSVDEAFCAYKMAKERVIRSFAEKYKGEINNRTYDSLSKWTVEVTD